MVQFFITKLYINVDKKILFITETFILGIYFSIPFFKMRYIPSEYRGIFHFGKYIFRDGHCKNYGNLFFSSIVS